MYKFQLSKCNVKFNPVSNIKEKEALTDEDDAVTVPAPVWPNSDPQISPRHM